MSTNNEITTYGKHEVRQMTSQSTPVRAWLLTWNPESWQWDEYRSFCVDTHNGKNCTRSWTCSSKKPVAGDEIFLIKTGVKPRGILAHGFVVRETYEAAHYNPMKAAEGITASHIDVEFDLVLDYVTEQMLMQDTLKLSLPEQQWSPMGSGIEIKPSVLYELRSMWRKTIGEREVDESYRPTIKEYDPQLTKEKWLDLLKDSEVTHVENLRVLKMMLNLGGESTCANLAETYGGSAAIYNATSRAFGERIHRKTNCPLYEDDGTSRYYTITFVGKYVTEKGKHRFSWKLRDELLEALKEMDLSNIDVTSKKYLKIAYDKNMILYGPPGTGKTYTTAIYAVAICDGKELEEVKALDYTEVMNRYEDLKKDGRIAFTTFHQSYGYEEFIEGIKPDVNKEKKILEYTTKPGVFKKFCEEASKKSIIENGEKKDFSESKVWCVLLDGAGVSELKKKCFEENSIRLGWKDYPATITNETPRLNDKSRRILLNFQEEMEIGDIVVTERSNKTIDGIGIITGEYEFIAEGGEWPRKRNIKWLQVDNEIDITDLNGGKNLDRKSVYPLDRIRPNKILSLINNPQKVIVEKRHEPYVFIIDEINRGNISKIFGELITLLEDTKREGMAEQASAVLPYSGEPFSVPSNVYIIGTMNTADRSIALMDTALRRRFQFVEKMPDTNVLREIGADHVENLDIALMLEKINERITFLYDREHTIGHAFFTKLAKSPDIKTLQAIFQKSVIPLLQEYFYEDYEKIQLVLGDNGKSDDSIKFILDEEVKVNKVFRGKPNDIIDLPEKRYRVNEAAFGNIESYKQII